MTNKSKAVLSIVVGSLLAGGTTTATKLGLIAIPPFSFSFLRFFIASLVILPFFIKAKTKIDKDFILLVAASLLPAINIFFFILGIQTTTATIGQLLYSGVPILTALFTFILLSEKTSVQKLLSILLGFGATAYIVLLPLFEKGSLFSGNIVGNALLSLGVFVYSLYLVLSKPFQKHYSPFVITAVFIFLTTFIFFLLSIFELRTSPFWWSRLDTTSVLAILYVGVPATIGGYVLNQYAIKFGGPVVASLSLYLLPIFAYMNASIFLGERLTPGLVAGALVVFISVALTTYTK
ncbi:DMT family transporter [Candidatus Roizmanbacteria bacterium]|nr:DMT family transporter [Candidatus Roizmanbacteria bacterium]